MPETNNSNFTITIDLDPVLEGFCRWVFKCTQKDTPIKINLRERIGEHIYSHIRTSRKPYPRPRRNNPVSFILPVTDNNKRDFRTNRPYINALDEEQIICYIRSEFKKWCEHKFEIGYKQKFVQREIANTILRALSVRNNSDHLDMIIKNDYRNRRKEEEKRFEKLLTDFVTNY